MTTYAHLVGVMIWRTNLYSGRQVEDNALIPGSSFTPSGLDGLADFYCEIGLGLSERFGAVLISELGSIFFGVLFRQLPNNFGVFYSEVHGLFFRVAEYDIPERG